MVENVVDDGVEAKPPIIEVYVDVKLSIEAFVEMKPTVVSKLCDNEVNTTLFFFSLRIDGECKMICLIGSQFLDNQSSQTKLSFPKRKITRIGNSLRSSFSTPIIHPDPNLPYITHMQKIIRPYIENIVNVKGDDNCGCRVIARHMSMDEENHVLVRSALIHMLKTNKCDRLLIFCSDERFEYIMNGLPPTNSGGFTYIDKWLILPDMGHIVATRYNKVNVQLINPERGTCENFFPI